MADIRVRVGQENAIKVVASVSGSAGGKAVTAENVIGGIASVSQLSVSGISTFGDSVSIAGSLTAGSFSVNNLTNDNLVTGIATISNQLYYTAYDSGVAYFEPSGLIVSTGSASTTNSINYSNYILTTNDVGTPTWSNVLDGGIY
jgi:hypothetical protein